MGTDHLSHADSRKFPSPPADATSAPAMTYQRSIDALRAQGCRCVLHWDADAQSAVPHTPGDAERCSVHGAKEAK